MWWIVWYADGTSMHSDEVGPEVLPALGVIVIVQYDARHGWAAVTGTDYYVWDDRGGGPRWWGVDQAGWYDYLISPGWRVTLFGRMVESERYNEILRLAFRDPRLPPKLAYGAREYRLR